LRGRSKRRTTEQNSQSPSDDHYSSPSPRQSSSKKKCPTLLQEPSVLLALHGRRARSDASVTSVMAVLPRADLLYGFAGTSVAATATGRCAARDRAGDVASRRRTEPISQIEGVSWRGLEAPRTPPPYAATSGVARAVVCLAGRLGIHLLFLSDVCLLFFPNFSLMPNTRCVQWMFGG
jgi:hypothetical protein